MRLLTKIALVTGALALAIGPAAFAAGKPAGDPPYGSAHGHNGSNYNPAEPTPGPKAGLPAQAKAYGRYCKEESRKHEKGVPGTPFSRCVKQMAQAATHEHMAPGRVCKEESSKHEKGVPGTPFSRCVKNVAQLRKHEKEEEKEQEEAASTTTSS